MRQTLDLSAEALGDAAADEGPFGGWRPTGPRPRVGLLAADGRRFTLAPGLYDVELDLRAGEVARPRLIYTHFDGCSSECDFVARSRFLWVARLASSQSVASLEITVNADAGPFLVARCTVGTEIQASTPRGLKGIAIATARAFYRAMPSGAQRIALRAASRLPFIRAGRTNSTFAKAAENMGRIQIIEIGSDLTREIAARRTDFDDRFAVSRGLGSESARIETSTSWEQQQVRTVAFYLPQFHRVPENDVWWGDGFTEWTNVTKAIPQFVGHHQPRLPGELGFYDLTAPDTLARQVALARAHGISAFCFHYYWFAGKRLLERPLNAFIADASLDLSFTLCWANENWTRRWDGADQALLIAQKHSREDHVRVFDDLARYLEDPRAIRIGGMPLVIVYRPAIIDDARAMTDVWRDRAAARGWPGVFIAATDAFFFDDPSALGFDGLIEFPPHCLTPPHIEKRLDWLNRAHRGAVFDYGDVAAEAMRRLKRRRSQPFAHFPGVMPSWDNEARRPGAGTIFHGASPQAYAGWLEAACACAARTLPLDRRLIFVNAWNEWAEGAYLEPDRKWGRAYLNATKAVMRGWQLGVARQYD